MATKTKRTKTKRPPKQFEKLVKEFSSKLMGELSSLSNSVGNLGSEMDSFDPDMQFSLDTNSTQEEVAEELDRIEEELDNLDMWAADVLSDVSSLKIEFERAKEALTEAAELELSESYDGE